MTCVELTNEMASGKTSVITCDKVIKFPSASATDATIKQVMPYAEFVSRVYLLGTKG
jgi:hypothetical protein